MDFVGWAFVAVIATYAFGGALLDAVTRRHDYDHTLTRLRRAMEQPPRRTGFWSPTRGRRP